MPKVKANLEKLEKERDNLKRQLKLLETAGKPEESAERVIFSLLYIYIYR